jgi:ATP-dependent protease ClpP protease subunit
MEDDTLYIHHLRLPPLLSDEPQYLDMLYTMLDVIVTAPSEANTLINIYCSGRGGYTEYASQLINAIIYAQANKKADITMIVNGPCSSNHAMIALTGEKIEIQKHGVYFLFHKGCGGFSNEDPVTKVMNFQKFLLDVEGQKDRELGIYDLLTKKEIVEYDKGDDIILKGEDMRKRLKKLGKEVW